MAQGKSLTDAQRQEAEAALKRGNHLPDGVIFDPAAELRGEPRFRPATDAELARSAPAKPADAAPATEG